MNPAGQASIAALVERNAYYLGQGRELIGSLCDEVFRRPPEPAVEGGDARARRGGIGPHLRHIVEHYECFLGGWREGRVDYDRRARDARLETDRAAALERIEGLVRGLRELEPRALRVASDCGEGPGQPRTWSESSVERELVFLASHTVHHYAVVAVLLRLAGLEPGRDFGVAPSTLRYEQGDPLCAR